MPDTGQIQVWDFRANEDYYTHGLLLQHLHKLGKKFTFQLEEGGTTGYRHWQGRISLWKVKRESELKKLWRGTELPLPNYLKPTVSSEHKKEAFYCMKEDTRVEGPWTDKDKAAYIPIQYRNLELWPYQQTIVDSKGVQDWRVVDCVIDPSGNNGKSTVASIADLMHGCIDLPPVNDGDKVIQSLCDILIAKQERSPGIVFFDLPRSVNKEKLGGMFTAIEQIKKGKVYDPRHSYKEWWFDSPRVWVFTNAKPDLNLLSIDRWRFWTIDDKELVPY